MSIANIPEVYIKETKKTPDLFVYDLKVNTDMARSKVNLNMNMFSFLQLGKKQVHFADTSLAVNPEQSLLLKQGRWLWTEYLDTETHYFCKLLFFSEKKLIDFLNKNSIYEQPNRLEKSYFIIENDAYIASYLNSLNSLDVTSSDFANNLLSIKFEELMLYLLHKHGYPFRTYLQSLISKESSEFRKVVDNNVYSNLKLDEIAFLCNMSISTFKRHFISEYKVSPGKWFRNRRLQHAKDLLQKGTHKSSDIYLEVGYSSLSNFSIAFKNKFGINPKDISK